MEGGGGMVLMVMFDFPSETEGGAGDLLGADSARLGVGSDDEGIFGEEEFLGMGVDGDMVDLCVGGVCAFKVKAGSTGTVFLADGAEEVVPVSRRVGIILTGGVALRGGR